MSFFGGQIVGVKRYGSLVILMIWEWWTSLFRIAAMTVGFLNISTHVDSSLILVAMLAYVDSSYAKWFTIR